jgi:hypothetical protein
MLMLAIFGYFYTVLPIYQKSLLDEEIAKKSLELNAMQSRIETTEALLKTRERELGGMNKKLSDMRVAADRAQAEVGKLRTDVGAQYAELLPRLLQDFQSLSYGLCKEAVLGDQSFADCVDKNVLPTANLAAIHASDRGRLSRILHARSPALAQAWREHLAKVDRSKLAGDRRANDAQARCDQLRASDDYKDSIKKISLDFQCNKGQREVSFAAIREKYDLAADGDKLIFGALNAIVEDFLTQK